MEQLAKTCKILYDKEFLDNQKLFKQGYSHQKVLYDSIQEYNKLEEEFRTQLSEVIKNIGLDNWYYDDMFKYKSELDIEQLYDLINRLIKNQTNKRVDNIINTIYLALDGLVESCNSIVDYTEDIICEECGSDVECNNCETIIQTNFTAIFSNKEFCNRMITNMILNILFSDTSRTEGIIDDIRQFKCQKCSKFDNWLLSKEETECNEEMCFECNEKLKED